jgi:arylsulfatase A-like enzyme
MNQLNFIATGLILISPINAFSKKTNPQKPNIVFIMSDDHAFQAISAYNSVINKTPNIDRIAREGITFDKNYVCNSISGPSRAAILTGKFSHINGFRDNGHNTIFDGSQTTFPKTLHENGYQTAVIGKWHLGSTPVGFDYYSIHVGQGTYYNPDFIQPQGKVRVEGYATDLTLLQSVEWLDKRDKNKPFCLMMQFKAPHRNWMPAPDKMSLYEDVTFPLPSTFNDDYKGRLAAQEQQMSIAKDMRIGQDCKIFQAPDNKTNSNLKEELSRMNEKQRKNFEKAYSQINDDFNSKSLSGVELAEWKYQRYMRDYLKCVSSVDDNVGKMIDYLQKNGLWENTIVVYTSDQGFYLGEHGWFDKRFMYEESFRSPLIVSYPAAIKKKNVHVKALTQNIDFAPTFLDFAGITVPEEMQGVSIKPLLEGTKNNVRDALYYHYYEYPMPHAVKRHYGITDGRYKLIHFYYDIDDWELFDLKNDAHELVNQINNKKYLHIKDKLMKQLNILQYKYKVDKE